jgi:hypothetical protein
MATSLWRLASISLGKMCEAFKAPITRRVTPSDARVDSSDHRRSKALGTSLGE